MAKKGIVYLVGAGPGDKNLLTIGALDVLKKADIVLYDRLVGKPILDMIPKRVKREYVGRAVGDDTTHQDSTNNIMIKHAQSGKIVARLKGGDPMMFGRGGEEAQFLHEHKIECKVIPGITSGLGSATYCGIPLTHRKFASSVTFVTGHEDPTKPKHTTRWKKLAKASDTIVIVMGIASMKSICENLLSGGMKKDMPVAIIENGTTSKQRMTTGTLSTIYSKAKKAKVKAPAVIIVGKVVELARKTRK